MKTKKFLTITILISVFFLLINCGHGSHKCDLHYKGMSEKQINKIAESISSKLDLTEEQNKKLTQIKNEIIEKKKDLQPPNREEFKNKLAELVKKEKITADELDNVFEEKHSLHREHQKFFMQKLAEFHSILTPEQKEKLANHVKEHKHEKKHKCDH